jgi:ribosomal protein S18 acetylase RimI-like enzyme
MKFRAAVAKDVPAIVALVESAYRGDASRAGWTTEADLLDGQRTDPGEVSSLISEPAARILLAESEEGLLGSVLLRDEGGAVYIGMFAVRPGLQGQGLGRALLNEAERVGRDELKRREARMTVLVQRAELIAWYERRGYRRTGEREPFPYGDPLFGLPRRDDLAFEVLRKDLGLPTRAGGG